MNKTISPIKIASIYAVFGVLWILLSDSILHILVNDADLENRIQTFKGWFFIAVTALLVYGLTKRMAINLRNENQRLNEVKSFLKESEKRQLDVLNNTPSLILMKDLDGRFMLVNKRFEERFNVKATEIIGKTLYDVFPQETAARLRRNDKKVINNGKVFEFEEEVPNSTGTLDTYFAIKFPIRDTNGKIYAICTIATDITDRKLLEEQIRRAQKMEAVGQLTGGIAHDFNNILGIIQGNLELMLMDHDLNEETRAGLEDSMAASKRATNLIAKLLGFSRKKAQSTEIVSINQSIDEMSPLIEKSLTAAINVSQHLADDLWPVEIDPGDFQDAMLNLAINARDAMPDGGSLIIETENKILDEAYVQRNKGSRAGEFVMISISDTGHGMSQDIQDKVFDPFFTTKDKSKGTGLGMSMVYGFIQRTGGHIKIYSGMDKGTTIRLYLPRLVSIDPEDHTDDHIPDDLNTIPDGNERILIVDDEADLRRICQTYLEKSGYQTLVAKNANAALKVLKAEEDIDLILSDIIMPGRMDGYALATRVKQEWPGIKILLTSGFTAEREKYISGDNPLLADLSRNLLPKPYNQKELAIAIRKCLDA